jgi:hypothetical protein
MLCQRKQTRNAYPWIVLDSKVFSAGLCQARVLAGSSFFRLRRRSLPRVVGYHYCALLREHHE